MTTTTDRVCEVIPVRRQNGVELVTVNYFPADGPLRATLRLDLEWSARKRTYRLSTVYLVTMFDADPKFQGTAFRLVKEDGEFYDCLISGRGLEWDACDCLGGLTAERRRQHCKHCCALRFLMEHGYLR